MLTTTRKVFPFSNILKPAWSLSRRVRLKSWKSLDTLRNHSFCACSCSPVSPSRFRLERRYYFPPVNQNTGSASDDVYVITGSGIRGIHSVSGERGTTTGRVSFLSSNSDEFPQSQDESNGDAFGPERKPGRTLEQVISQLHFNIRRKMRIHRADIHQAVELLEQAKKVLDMPRFLLSCCCDVLPDLQPSYRIKLCERIWTVVQKSQEYTSSDFEAFLKALALNEDDIHDPLVYLEEAKSVAGIHVTGTMYYFALLIVCQRGDMDGAVEILNLMKENNISVNEKFFNALILGYARSGDMKSARDIVEMMNASKIEPSAETWTKLLQAYIESGNLEQLQTTYSELTESPAKLSEDQFYELLKAAGKQSNFDILDLVIGWAASSGLMHYTSIINLSVQLLHSSHLENALTFVKRFSETLRAKDEYLGTFIIRELKSTNINADDYVNLISSLQRDDLNPYAFNIAAEISLKHQKFDLVYKIYEAMALNKVPVRPHYFLPLIIEEIEREGLAGGMKVLKQMKSLDIKPDSEMLAGWIIPKLLAIEGNILKVLKLIQDITGMSYSSGLVNAGLIATLLEKDLKQTLVIVSRLEAKVTSPESVMQALWTCYTHPRSEGEAPLNKIFQVLQYISQNVPPSDQRDFAGFFLVRLIHTNRLKEAEQMLNYITKSQTPLSQTAATTVEAKLNTAAAAAIKVDEDLELFNGNGRHTVPLHPREMDTTGLECHAKELESKDLNRRGVDRKLFLKYCQTGDLTKALSMKREFEIQFGDVTPGMKSALMGAYILNDLLDEAFGLYQELTKEGSKSDVEIDTYKFIDLATLLVQNDRCEEGVRLIEESCLTKPVKRPETFTRNIIRFLDNLSRRLLEPANAELQLPTDAVYKLTEQLLEKKVLTPSNPTLVPSIKDAIRRKKLDDAVCILEEYAKKYSLSPCIQELTYAVLEEPKLLERVVKCSAQTRGKTESKRLLAIARSDVGDLDGAAAGFRELGDGLKFIKIIKQCEYWASKHDIKKLLNLITALHKTGRNYDCKTLYTIAIDACQRKDDNESLQKVISNMEDHDMYVPPKLRNKQEHS